MHKIETFISTVSSFIWSIFIPVLIILALYVIFSFFTKVKKKTTIPSKINPKDIIGPVSISLGAMIGTGAIIGVLGSMLNLYANGQVYFEAIAGWSFIGAIILIPICYIETLVCKITKSTPKNYISAILNKRIGKIYAYCFIFLYVFGFGGFQVQGINNAITIVVEGIFNISSTPLMRYIVVVIPLLLIVSVIVLSRKHEVFISSMAIMIGTAVIMYLIMVVIFVAKTNNYIPIYIHNILVGMQNPVTAGIGIPLGLTVAIQRITQTSEPGLGALGMSSLDSDSEPTAAGLISLIPSILTVFIAIFITSYITSYGFSVGLIDMASADSLEVLRGYFLTCLEVSGLYGLISISAFTILSGITSLLGSYYFLNVLLDQSENKNIALYIALIFSAGTIAIFGGSFIFEAVDLLLFIVIGINITAITMFCIKYYKNYLV